MSLVAGETGKTLILNCGFDLTGQTGLTLDITRPDGTTFQKTNATGLSVGGADLVVDGVTYLANQYITYVLVDGDISIAGIYKRKLSVDFPTKKLITITEVFEVEE